MITVSYYIIPAEDAQRLGVTRFRKGNAEHGYVVTPGDLSGADAGILQRARKVTERQALNFIKKL